MALEPVVVGEDTRAATVLLSVAVVSLVPPWPAGIVDELALPVKVPRNELALVLVAIGIFVSITSSIVWFALKSTIGLRISKEAEKLGTDKAEIGVVAYSIRD